MSFENELQYPPEEASEKTEEPLPEATQKSALSIFQWKSFLLFLAAFCLVLCHWLTTSDLFEIPEDVSSSRTLYAKAKERYLANASYWNAKQQQLIQGLTGSLKEGITQPVLEQLQETPGEILISLFLQKMTSLEGLGDGHVTIFRKENVSKENPSYSLVITKPEPGIWPLNIMLSLELDVKIQAQKLLLQISRCRRGSQDLALGLSWAYFGPELEAIRYITQDSKNPFTF
jgi:hypothetical protein